MESEKEKKLITAYRTFMDVGMGADDPSLLPGVADERIFGLGTAFDEKIEGIPGLEKLLENQRKQSEGLDIRWQTAPVFRHITEDENTAVFVDDASLTIRSDEGTLDIYLRLSVVLHYGNDQWKVIHWHSSKPEHVESDKDTWGVDSWKQRALELEQLVEEKTADLVNKNRELAIVAALEKVRAVAMGMREPADMADVCRTIKLSLEELGFTDIRNVQTAIFYPEKGIYLNYEYFNEGDRALVTEVAYREQPDIHAFVNEMLTGPESAFTRTFDGDELRRWTAYQHAAGQYVPPRQESAPELHYLFHSIGPGALGLSTYRDLSDEQRSIMLRFRHVFAMAYRRYSDIEQALAQAREAQVEAALENVRSRALSMHNSDELLDVVTALYERLSDLKIPATAVGIGIYIDGTRDYDVFVCGQQNGRLAINNYRLPYFNHRIANDLYDAREKGMDFFTRQYTKEEKDNFYEYVFEHSALKWELPDEMRQFILQSPAYAISAFPTRHAVIHINDFGGISMSAAEIDVLKRFAHVFEQAYTRFLDLQKAEAQAREAQVEAALERVRSRSLSMHRTDELQDVVNEVARQLMSMGIDIDGGIFVAINADVGTDLPIWASAGAADYMQKVTIPFMDRPAFTALRDAILNREPFFTEFYSKAEKDEFLQHLFRFHPWNQNSEERKAELLARTGGYARSVSVSSHTAIGMINHHGKIFSEADNTILRRFGAVLEQSYTRFLDLQKAEAQAREAQIEIALERVRARTMAMERSEELLEVASIMFQQVKALGVPQWNCGFNIWNIGDTAFTYYPGTPDGIISQSPCTIPLTEHPIFREFDASRKRGDELLVYEKEGEFQRDHYQYMLSLPGVGDLLRSMLQAGFTFPEFQIDHVANFAYGNLIFITYTHFPEMHDVFKRFAKVFEQTYTRFLDLQKAEAQAREADVELALERIRAQAMAMKESADLLDIVVTMRREFTRLGHEAHYFWHMMWLPDKYEKAMTSGDGTRIGMVMELPRGFHELDTMNAWEQNDEPVGVFALDVETAVDYIGKMITLGKFQVVDPNAPTLDDIRHINGLTFVMARTTHGEIGYSLPGVVEHPPAEDLRILERFAGAFDIAHQRFLDLKRSEARAREVQVELALERVRNRTLAMQRSDELADAAFVLFEQLNLLGIVHERINIGIVNEAEGMIDFWITRQGGKRITTRFSGRISEPTTLAKAFEAWKRGDKSLVIDLQGEDLRQWLAFMRDEIKIPFDPAYMHDRRVQTAGFFSKGMLVVTSPEPLQAEALHLLERFAGVFDLTYTRFSDLQVAEAQARTARIEAALERVRARALAMQEPEELREIAKVLRHEMGLLGVEELETSTVFIHDRGSEQAECWFAIRKGSDPEDGLVSDHIPLDLPATWVGRQMDTFFNSEDVRTSILMQGPHRREWIEYCYGLSSTLDGFYGESIPDRTYHLYKFSNGAIGAAAPGDISTESWDLLQRTASVFSLAYARFRDLTQARIDLQRLKDEKSRAEQALSELRAAQAQLVQSEKMASLGELTAGIAHEIKNPLNFVNNFAEVSGELFDELKTTTDPDQRTELIDLLQNNLEKINEHGKRADAIVRSMLQHSRSESGKKEPTDLNALADEYLRLAYHGLRAKDKSFNATFKAELDPALPNVGIVPQDIGRVLLNLINNAFYAVSEWQRRGDKDYVPTVTVRTLRAGDSVEIHVADNGSGIPDAIRDKIFQPFFTTKPTGQGTGLGLSLAYDIVTKGHRGDLRVETKEGAGTTFTIVLPCES